MKSKFIDKVCEITGFKREEIFKAQFEIVDPHSAMFAIIKAGYKQFYIRKGKIMIKGLPHTHIGLNRGTSFFEVSGSPFVKEEFQMKNHYTEGNYKIMDSFLKYGAIRIIGIQLIERPTFLIRIHMSEGEYYADEADKEECLRRMKEHPYAVNCESEVDDRLLVDHKTMREMEKEAMESYDKEREREELSRYGG